MKNNKSLVILFTTAILLGFFVGSYSSINDVSTNQDTELIKFIHTSSSFISSNSDYIIPNQYNVDILHYDLDIDLYPKDKILKGTAQITGLILQPHLNIIDLNFYDNLNITSIKLNQQDCKFENKNTRLSIYSNKDLSDTFKLFIQYEGRPKKAGLSGFVFGEINGRSVVYNLNEPSYASTWFPCNDFPSDKAMLDIKITNDTSQVSVSNGILVSKVINRDRKTYHWKTLYPISTYLICLYSSDYVELEDFYISTSNDTMPIKYFVFPEHVENAKVDFSSTSKIISLFAKIFGEYPFIKEKYGIAEFLWQIGAMEHQTITGIGSNFISGKNYFEDVFIHELAHHWWGNAVGPSSWEDIWLNEGFATYSEALYEEALFGKTALKKKMQNNFADEYSGTVYNPGKNLFSSTVYDKGAWILHMLRWEIGDSIFFNVLRQYFETFKYKNASSYDFIALCEKASNRSLEKFFDQWLFNGTENINLDYKWIIKSVDNKFKLILDLVQKQEEYDHFDFKLEVMFEYDDEKSFSKIVYVNNREMRFEFVLDNRPNQVILDPNNWLLANINDRNSYE